MFGWLKNLFGKREETVTTPAVAAGDPRVEMMVDADGAPTAPTVKISVGEHTLLLTHSQAQNLWGELGAINRKIKKLYPADGA